MKSRLIPGVDPLPFDKEIAAFVKKQPHNPFPGRTQKLAVLNLKGELYRVIEADGPGEAIALLNAVAARDLYDRIQLSQQTFEEIDLLTGERYRGQYDAVLQVGNEIHPLPR